MYNSLTPVTSGNFNISTLLIATAFQSTTDALSEPFDAFRSNRLIVANSLASEFYGTDTFPVDPETGYLIDIKKLKTIMKEEVEDYLDHKNLNLDVPDFATLNPSAENIVWVIWEKLRKRIDN